MSATNVAAGGPVREGADFATTYRLLWLAVISDSFAFGVGFEWDIVDLILRARVP